MIEEKLEILLITYNRAKDLENTLEQLIESPFANCKITLLDNCSTDRTPEVCQKYQQLFTNMNIIRHPRNIGANPNYLRAVERSNSEYTWILADDDLYNFSDCTDVFKAIKSNKPDIIIVTSHAQYGWERGLETTSNELIKNSKYYHTLSFMPAIIFKTELFDSNCIHKGYFNVHNLYPHFEFINKSVENNFKVYVSKKWIVKAGTSNPSGFTLLYWEIAWIDSCTSIKNKKFRRQAIHQSPLNISFLRRIIMSIIIEKNSSYDNEDIIRFISSFIIAFSWSWDLFLLLFIIPTAFIPSFIYKIFFKSFRYMKYDILKKERPKEIYHKKDQFRY